MKAGSLRAGAIIVGPLPPAVGGVASLTEALYAEFGDRKDVWFIDSNKYGGSALRSRIRNIRLFCQLVWHCARKRPHRVLLFGGSGISFLEKLCWATVCRLLRAEVVLLMVDGGFPVKHLASGPFRRRLSSLLVRSVHTLGAQSSTWASYYRRTFPKSRVSVVRAGVDVELYAPGLRTRAPSEPVRLLFVGWLIEDKGIFDLLEAIRLLRHRGESVVCRLVGPTFGREDVLLGEIRRLGLDGVVDLAGVVDRGSSLRSEYVGSDIFVLPSHFEGFPNVLLEAMACGLACVGTRVGGVPDILDYGTCGIVVSPNDPQALANGISVLVGDADGRREFGRLARSRAVHEFALERAMGSYRQLLGL